MSARRQFLAECGKAAAAFVLMACEQDKLLAPCAPVLTLPGQIGPEKYARLHLYIVDSFNGSQDGTEGNPYAVRTRDEFDALMSYLVGLPLAKAFHLSGKFSTRGEYRWGTYAGANWRLSGLSTLDGAAEISLDPEWMDEQPLFVIASQTGDFEPQVSGVTLIGNHSALADRWNAAGKSLRTGGALLYGDGAGMDRLTLKNFGALGAETFVAEIIGYGNITDCEFREHDPSSTNSQVSVYRTMGSENGERSSDVLSIHAGNRTFASGSRLVQAHTIYQSPGLVRNNTSVGADVLYYGDYFQSRDVVIEENDATECVHGVQLRLSRTPLPQAASFSHERYVIGKNRFASSGAQVSLDTSGPTTDSRFIRDIQIHPTLTVENFGATDVRRGSECRRAA